MGLSRFQGSVKQNNQDKQVYVQSLREEFKAVNPNIDTIDLEHLVDAFKDADPDMDKKVPFDRLASLVSDANLDSIPAHELRNFLRAKDSKMNFITPNILNDILLEVKRHEAENDPGFTRNLAKTCSVKVVKKRNQNTDKIDAFYDRDEVRAFAKWINLKLKGKNIADHVLPIDPEDPDKFFAAMTDGIVLCLMLQLASENLIDDRAINPHKSKSGSEMMIFKKIENLNLAINTAKSIGCNTVNQDPTFIMDMNPTMCLGLVWQIIRAGILIKINLNDNPYLMNLAYEGETKEDLLKLSQEELLLRWVNYHLERNENYTGNPIRNFSSDIKDSVAYQYLMEEIQPKNPNLGLKADPSRADLLDRAEDTLQMADKLDCRVFIEPINIVKSLSVQK
jgi:hypothetical protein